MIKRILVALSGSPFTDAAIEHALELARSQEAELTGVTDVDLGKVANVGPVPMGAGAAAHDLIEHRLQLAEQQVEDAIRRFEKATADARGPCNVVRETGSPFERLIDLWRYHDLVVAGLRGLFEYGVIHNPDDLLLRLISRGVRPILAVSRQRREIRRVLVAYHGSLEAAKTMKHFVQMSLWPDVEMQIVCFEKDREEADRLLADAAAYCALYGYNAETLCLDGSPRDGLLEHAAEIGADMIVLGCASRARLFKHLLGDVTLHAIRHAEIPLFLAQ
jgi:nucleotide-binding universal stress UspA family protein